MKYPLRDATDWKKVGRLSLIRRLQLRFRNKRFQKRARSRDGIELAAIRREAAPPAASDIILICIMKNAEKYLPSFLSHYRRIGIGRFAFVDDQSSDGTRAALCDQPDVDLYESNVDFRGAGGGLIWRDMLVDLYGRNRWYVSIDSDEYLIFPGCEVRPLAAFAADLERHGLKRSLAVMIDIYPDAPLGEALPHTASDALPTAVSPLYDGDGYRLANEKFCTAVRGGPRQRLFGTTMRLTKFPLIYVDAQTQFAGGSHHGPLPIWRNYSAVHAVLLHYKFSAGAVKEFAEIAARGTHYNGSSYYKDILKHDAFNEAADFRYPASARFEDSAKLVRTGFMQDLRQE